MPSTTRISPNEAVRRFLSKPTSQAREIEREELLMTFNRNNLEAWGASKSYAAAMLRDRTKILMTVDNIQGAKIVIFAIQLPNSQGLKTFWFNEHSVKHLGELMRSMPAKRMDFPQLLSL